jgi:hypothetical protein
MMSVHAASASMNKSREWYAHTTDIDYNAACTATVYAVMAAYTA